MAELDIIEGSVEVTKEIAKDLYADIAKPSAQAIGSVLSLLPRSINAALAPIWKWILRKEASIKEEMLLLERKLSGVPETNIASPEPYIAVPAFQALSYSIDNVVIKEMYANLLAASMITAIRNDVHPSFVEIIKQLTPDEARLLKYIATERAYELPLINLRRVYENIRGEDVEVGNFSNVFRKIKDLEVHDPIWISVGIDNMCRLGLGSIPQFRSLVDAESYEELKRDEWLENYKEKHPLESQQHWGIDETLFRLTDFGKAFVRICIDFETTRDGVA